LLQQRHLRRVIERLMVGLTSKKPCREENEKEQREENETDPPQEKGISNCQLSTTFIPPLTPLALRFLDIESRIQVEMCQ